MLYLVILFAKISSLRGPLLTSAQSSSVIGQYPWPDRGANDYDPPYRYRDRKARSRAVMVMPVLTEELYQTEFFHSVLNGGQLPLNGSWQRVLSINPSWSVLAKIRLGQREGRESYTGFRRSS